MNTASNHARGCLRWLALLLAAAVPGLAATAGPPLPVRVMIINMFGLEAAPWLAALPGQQGLAVPGLPADYPSVHCTPQGICQMTTGMGHANAAASLMAVIYSGQFDLHQTYFLIAGIAGIDPALGTIGSVAWARYAVDTGIAHEIDARDMPRSWHDGYYGVLTDGPGKKPRLEYRTEMFRLDESLLQRALALSRSVTLEDSDDVAAYRRRYVEANAKAAPRVIQCDTASSDTWWAGPRLERHARDWTALLTDGAGRYCSTQEEDNATLLALTRGSQSGLLNMQRVAILRSGSDFDRPYPGQSTPDSLRTQLALSGAGRIAADNLVRAGMPLVQAIAGHWEQWREGVPPG
jgi:purine nucleoside permease